MRLLDIWKDDAQLGPERIGHQDRRDSLGLVRAEADTPHSENLCIVVCRNGPNLVASILHASTYPKFSLALKLRSDRRTHPPRRHP